MFANLCTSTISVRDVTFAQLISLAQEHGFGGLDVPSEALASLAAADEAARMMSEAGLRWGIFWLPVDFSSCSDADFRGGIRALQRMLPPSAGHGVHALLQPHMARKQ